MLQQTRVQAVAGYFGRFTERFPGVVPLADAHEDEVLHLWSGLGYYARARNLHRAARVVRDEHGGEVPRDLDALLRLPGIGRSTAGAILALSAGQRHPILDGNVKRVLCRYHAVAGWPGRGIVSRELWRLADAHTPQRGVRRYTQAMMDLGATVCLRRRPLCGACPVAGDCEARRQGRQEDLPEPKPRANLPQRCTTFLIVRDAGGRVLLERRPPAGLWGGLWSFPECEPGADPVASAHAGLGLVAAEVARLATVRHGFSHYRLDIEPVVLALGGRAPDRVADAGTRRWCDPAAPGALGLAAPVAALLEVVRDVR